jgi:hypothetical protein
MAMKKASGKMGNGQYGDAEHVEFNKDGDNIEGYLVEKGNIRVDDRDIPRYVFQTDNGLKSTLGSYKLNELLEEVEVGCLTRVTFRGKEKIGGGRTLKQFEVEYDSEVRIPG